MKVDKVNKFSLCSEISLKIDLNQRVNVRVPIKKVVKF